LAGQPEPPAYFAVMKRMNKEGPAILNGLPHVPEVPVNALADHLARGAVVVDTRHPGAFAEGHLPGTINIPLNRSFTTWAGWLVQYDKDIYLITDEGRDAALAEAVRDLAMIGLDRVAGHVPGTALESWQAEGASRGTITMINVDQLHERMQRGEVAVVDVRGASEWQEGHLPGVPNIPVGYLVDRREELPRDRPLVLQCRSGARSAIAASVLQAAGMTNVVNLVGGYAEWVVRGLPVEMPEAEGAAV
ncbi:MAG: rhodanese-like domain-containing protein, partial [Gemmatimonadetes bacterium]|nr:rhodanese-like domain-containing protein [Gemmatimonadota bacterium]